MERGIRIGERAPYFRALAAGSGREGCSRGRSRGVFRGRPGRIRPDPARLGRPHKPEVRRAGRRPGGRRGRYRRERRDCRLLPGKRACGSRAPDAGGGIAQYPREDLRSKPPASYLRDKVSGNSIVRHANPCRWAQDGSKAGSCARNSLPQQLASPGGIGRETITL
jgi:hypothetical protein